VSFVNKCFVDIGDLEPPIDELDFYFHIDIPVTWFVTTLYKANATATPTELAMQIWMAFAIMITAFMLFCFNWLRYPQVWVFRLLKCSSVNLLWVQSPIVICFERLLNKHNFPTLIGVACAMQFVANVLATEMLLFYLYQRPVDKCFEGL
jgi:hypothetical protein